MSQKLPNRITSGRTQSNRLSPGALARRNRRKNTKRKKTLDDAVPAGSLFKDRHRAEILQAQDEIDELAAQHEVLKRKIKTGQYRPGDDYKITEGDLSTYQTTYARRQQIAILSREKMWEKKREEELQVQRQIGHSLEAAQKFRRENAGEDYGDLAPFFVPKSARERARRAFKRVKSTLFGQAGPLEGGQFTINTFKQAREAQIGLVAKMIPNELIHLEIERRNFVHDFAVAYNNLVPYSANPMLKLSPMYGILRTLTRDPSKAFNQKSLFLVTQHNPYREYYSQILPIVEAILATAPKITQRSAKDLIYSINAEATAAKRDIEFFVGLQHLRRNRLLKSRYRRIRQLARECWLYVPPSLDTLNSIKTTPVFFHNGLIRKTMLKAIGYKSTAPSPLAVEDQASFWLNQIPVDGQSDDVTHKTPPSFTPQPNFFSSSPASPTHPRGTTHPLASTNPLDLVSLPVVQHLTHLKTARTKAQRRKQHSNRSHKALSIKPSRPYRRLGRYDYYYQKEQDEKPFTYQHQIEEELLLATPATISPSPQHPFLSSNTTTAISNGGESQSHLNTLREDFNHAQQILTANNSTKILINGISFFINPSVSPNDRVSTKFRDIMYDLRPIRLSKLGGENSILPPLLAPHALINTDSKLTQFILRDQPVSQSLQSKSPAAAQILLKTALAVAAPAKAVNTNTNSNNSNLSTTSSTTTKPNLLQRHLTQMSRLTQLASMVEQYKQATALIPSRLMRGRLFDPVQTLAP